VSIRHIHTRAIPVMRGVMRDVAIRYVRSVVNITEICEARGVRQSGCGRRYRGTAPGEDAQVAAKCA